MHNPSLREEPVEQLAPIMASRKDASILDWLERSGRLMERDTNERTSLNTEDDIEEINALMSGEDDFDDDDDDAAE